MTGRALHANNLSSIPGTTQYPLSVPGMILELRARGKSYALPGMAQKEKLLLE